MNICYNGVGVSKRKNYKIMGENSEKVIYTSHSTNKRSSFKTTNLTKATKTLGKALGKM